jgi:putative transcriptional regulator
VSPGNLLVARPELFDPNFRRTVVYVASHDADGTLGFVMNRPTGQRLAEFVSDRPELEGLGDVPVYVGGPVGMGQLLVAAIEWHAKRKLVFRHNLPPEEIAGLRRETAVSVRAFIGHSGWADGQLDAELREGSWLTVPPEPWLLDPGCMVGAWSRVLRGQGPWYRLMSEMPEDPSRN